MDISLRFWVVFVFGMLFAVGYTQRTNASETVDLELVLLADATGSIDDAEILFQRSGYAQAITHPQVISAIVKNAHGRIAVTYVEWGDMTSQEIVVDWTIIDGPESAAAFARELLEPPRRAFGRNAIGAALLFAKSLIDQNDIRGLRRVIDISADSANNWNGPGIESSRDSIVATGIIINGLAVLCRHCSGRPISYDLEAAFADRIIGGPGSFVITADSPETFSAAVRRKLILEIAERSPKAKSAKLTRTGESKRF
ncbi:MAG: DUF1194 domain-containing protein [Rhizobiaceae bacterium]